MHLTRSHWINHHHSQFELLDFISWQSNALANQTIYTLRQPLTYVDNIRHGKATHTQQVEQIRILNQALTQHLFDRYMKADDQPCLAQCIAEHVEDGLFNTDFMDMGKDIYLSDTFGLVGKDLLQYHMKTSESYQVLYSQSSQQVLHQILDNFQSYWKLVTAFKQGKIKDFPKLPYYKEKVSGRNVVFFCNQQIKREGKYLVLTWMGDALRKQVKSNPDRIYTYRQALSANDIGKMTDKNGQFFKLKSHQKIVHDNEKNEVYLETSVKLPNKLKIKSDVDLKSIAQIRLVPAQALNPVAYKFEIVYEKEIAQSADEVNLLNQAWTDLEIKQSLKKETKAKKSNKDKLIKGKKKIHSDKANQVSFKIEKTLAKQSYFISHAQIEALLSQDKNLLNQINIAAIDPGMKRLFSMTFKAGEKPNNPLKENSSLLQPLNFDNHDMLAFNQYMNKTIAKMQEQIKTQHGQDYSAAVRQIDLKRKHKITNDLHQISAHVIHVLKTRHIDLLLIGKNQGQKQDIELGSKNNQKFVQIPFNQLWTMIAYKAYQSGILVCYQEESYSSKASCLLTDIIPVYNEADANEVAFEGVRVKGLYHHHHKGVPSIHADVNGSYNIMRKFLHQHGQSSQIFAQAKRNHLQQIGKKTWHHLFIPQTCDMADVLTLNAYQQALQKPENKPMLSSVFLADAVGVGSAQPSVMTSS